LRSLRISIVQYLNTAPLVRGFTHGPLRGKYQLSFTVPSQCAEALRSNQADVAIIPAIEYQRIQNLVILPNLSISSKKAVRSLLLISKMPVRDVARIALDRSSRSTQALTRILCRKWWGIKPEFFEADSHLPPMLQHADAALLIGDPALRIALAADSGARRDRTGLLTCAGAVAGCPEMAELFLYDIVEEWRALAGLPAVLAVWAGRRNAITPEVARDFQDSLAFGMKHLDEISREASVEMGFPALELRRYLAGNIDYGLDEENMKGLRLYYNLAAELGLISNCREIAMADVPIKSEPHSELAGAQRP
jgi:predicted solute-binding protein